MMLILELFKVLIILFLFYFIGKALISPFSESQKNALFYHGFLNLLIGSISVITILAIIKTSFNTILIGFILIAFIYVIREKPRFNPNRYNHFFSKEDLKVLGVITILTSIFFLIPLFFFYNTPYNNMPHGDYYFYARLANSLNEYGVESGFYLTNPLSSQEVGASPYHYFEIWIAVLFAKLFDVSYVDAVVVHSNVLFSTILVMGTMAISRELTKQNWGLFIAFTGVFFSGILTLNFLPQVSSFVEYGAVFFSKYSVISVFFCLLILETLRKNSLHLYSILILPIINISLAPTIFIAICIYYFFGTIKNKNYTLFFKNLGSIFSVAIFIAVFYSLQKSGESSIINFDSIILIHKTMPLKIIQIIIGAFVIISGIYIFYFIPVIPLIKSKSNLKHLLIDGGMKHLNLFFILVLFISVFVWAVMHPMHDSVQFHIMPAYLFLNLLIVLFLIKGGALLKEKLTKAFYFVSFSFLLLIIVIQLPTKSFYRITPLENVYSVEYISEIVEVLSKKEYRKIGGVLHPDIIIKSSDQANTYWLSNRPPLIMFFPEFNLIDLAIDEYIIDGDFILKERAKLREESSLYMQYIKNNDLDLNNINENRRDFILTYNIPFVICRQGTDIPEDLDYVKRIEDQKSGEKMYILY